MDNRVDLNKLVDLLLSVEGKVEDKNISLYAIAIDAYAAGDIIDFFNKNKNVSWRAHLIIIRYFAIIIYEMGKWSGCDVCKEFNFSKLKELRLKIHQFRANSFDKYYNEIEDNMGRSKDIKTPMLDLCLEYETENGKNELIGTNVWKYYFYSDELQNDVNIMQQIIRFIQQDCAFNNASCNIHKSTKKVKYKLISYCYTDILKNSGIKKPRLVDRVILSIDELSSLLVFLENTIYIDVYLSNFSYVLMFLCKFSALIFDETIDNLTNYIKYSDDEDAQRIVQVLKPIKKELINSTRIIRNNIHYNTFQWAYIKTYEEMYDYIENVIKESKELRRNLLELLGINPSKGRLIWYKFLANVQSDRVNKSIR